MIPLLRFFHIVGLSMFFGSILGHVATSLVHVAGDTPTSMLAVRQAIVLGDWYVTVPGLAIAFASGAILAANSKYTSNMRLALHILIAVVILAIAGFVLLPVAFELRNGAERVAAGAATGNAIVTTAQRETIFGATNIALTVVAIAAGVALAKSRIDK